MTEYNILPLALGDDYYVLAKAGVLIPPLKQIDSNTIDCSGITVNTGLTSQVPEEIIVGGISLTTVFDAHITDISEAVEVQAETSLGITGTFHLIGLADSSGIEVETSFVNSIFDTVLVGSVPVYALIDTSVIFVLDSSGLLVSTDIESGFYEFEAARSVIYYIFTLTGTQDSTSDIEIPIASFQGRLRSGEQSYLSVVIPYTDNYADAITARSNGDLKIDMAYEIEGTLSQRETIALVHLDNIRIDRGGNNASITLSGYRQETYSQKTVTLKNSTYYRLSGGNKTYRFATPNMDLNPGDIVNVGDDSFTADLITYVIGTNTKQMEISEQ